MPDSSLPDDAPAADRASEAAVAAPARRGRRTLRRAGRAAAAAAGAWEAVLARARATLRDARLARLRALTAGDPAAALARIARARRRRPRARVLAETEALIVARRDGWAAAAPLLVRLAGLPPRAAGAPAAAAVLRDPAPGPALELALPDRDRPAALPRAVAARVVLYTAAFGDSPPPPPLFQAVPGLRALLLTDRALAVPGWETRAADPDPDPVRALHFARIRGPELLAAAAPGTQASLWIDPGLRPVGNLDTLLARWLWPQDLALWRHPRAHGWHELAEERLTAEPDPAAIALAAACAAEGLPRRAGACDPRLVWRRHAAPAAAALTAAWWERAEAAPGAADLALAAALAAPAAPRPAILPAALGPADDGAYFAAAAPPAAAARRRPLTAGPLPVVFLYAEAFASTASTYLRCGQLADLVAEHDPDRFAVRLTSDAETVRDALVVLAKGALQTLSAGEIARLRSRNVAVVGAWDDVPPDPAKLAATDASMTLSHRSTLDIARAWPGTPAFHVTHHVNRRIRPSTPPADRLRAGYFGELTNTVLPDALAGLVELVGINTSKVETSWIDRLPEFNAHWIVRRRRTFDGAKPFLKGFLAARCGAVVICGRDDEDALAYLGDDYPFFVRSLDAAELEADMVGIAAAFGGPEWRLAQAIMQQVAARSTDAVVAAEFRAMVAALTA